MSYGYECDQLLATDYACSSERHLEFAEKAVALDELDSRAHYAMCCALTLTGQLERADAHAARAVELNPSEYHNLCSRGYTLMSLNRMPESIACFGESLRRNPLAPNSCLMALGLIEYLESNYGQCSHTRPRGCRRRTCSVSARSPPRTVNSASTAKRDYRHHNCGRSSRRCPPIRRAR